LRRLRLRVAEHEGSCSERHRRLSFTTLIDVVPLNQGSRRIAELKRIEEQKPTTLDVSYSVIVSDAPWPIERIRGIAAQNQRECGWY
jgi:hypothetical protein